MTVVKTNLIENTEVLQEKFRIHSVSAPSVFYDPPVTHYMLLYSTLLCKKIARAPGGHKRFTLTKLGGGGGGRIDPKLRAT